MNLINHTACQNKYIHVHATPVYTSVHTYVILCSVPVRYMSTSSGYARVHTRTHTHAQLFAAKFVLKKWRKFLCKAKACLFFSLNNEALN